MSEKTRAAIKKAFSELVNEKKSLTNITVTDITRKADINRSTFYAHYDNIHAIAEEYKEEILSVIILSDGVVTVEDYLELVFSFLEKNQDRFQLILEGEGVILFIGHLASLASENLIRLLKLNPESEEALQVHIISNGVAAAVVASIMGKTTVSLKEMKTCTCRLMEKLLH